MTAQMLLVANNFPPVRGGSAVVYSNVACAAGGRIDVIAPQTSYVDGLPMIGWREHDRGTPYRVRRVRLLRTIMMESPRSILHRARRVCTDLLIRARVLSIVAAAVRNKKYRSVCLGELLASGWMITPLQRLLRLRVIVYVHGEEITTRDLYDADKRRCRQFLHAADGIVVVSEFTRRVVLQLLGPGAADKVMLIGNGVAAGRFTPGPKRADLVARYELEGCFVFVSVCRLLEKKGLDNALRAFALLAHERSPAQQAPIRFLIVGTGPYEDTLARLLDELGIAASVVFAGSVPDAELIAHYRLGDVFVMPNRKLPDGDTEGFGLVFLEANGCGLPVIAGQDGGSTDAVKDGVNGLVVDGRSVPEIAAAMRRLRDDPGLHARLAASGLAAAAAADWPRKADQLVAFCRGLCNSSNCGEPV